MPPAATAHFMALRAELIVIERAAVPIFENGRQIGTEPAKTHKFTDHHCKVEGAKSIEFMRARTTAADGPEIWELDGASDVKPITDVLAELAVADVDRVREILAEEQDGPNRPAVLDTCRAVLDKIGIAERKPGQHEVLTS
jgi:hypothetical protein